MSWFIPLSLGLIHFSIPLIYFGWLSRKLRSPWSFSTQPVQSYLPKISIILPSYNERRYILDKLDNLSSLDYPRQLLELIIVDSSTDLTPDLIKKWAAAHPEFNLKLIIQPRMGKAKALNKGLELASGELIAMTEADSIWENKILRAALEFLRYPEVGGVSFQKQLLHKHPGSRALAGTELFYRELSNLVRIGESKIHSSPVINGECFIFKRELLEKFEDRIPVDDTGTAFKLIRKGYRILMLDSSWVKEYPPTTLKAQLIQKSRRARSLVHFFGKKLLELPALDPKLRKIFGMEFYLHLINPVVLLAAALSLPLLGWAGLGLLGLTGALCLLPIAGRALRSWIFENAALIWGLIRELIPTRKLFIWESLD